MTAVCGKVDEIGGAVAIRLGQRFVGNHHSIIPRLTGASAVFGRLLARTGGPMTPSSIAVRLGEDVKDAMRARDERRLSAIRMLRAAIRNLEISRSDRKDPKYGQPVTEADIVAIVQKEITQKRETIHFATVGNRTELLEKERAELATMEQYLPAMLSREEIRAAVDVIVAEVGRDFKKVMPLAAQALRGTADGKLVNEVVREATA